MTFDVLGNQLTVTVQDAKSKEPLNGATISIEYPGGTIARTLSEDSNSYAFFVPVNGTVISKVRVTHHGYIPWEGEVALSS